MRGSALRSSTVVVNYPTGEKKARHVPAAADNHVARRTTGWRRKESLVGGASDWMSILSEQARRSNVTGWFGGIFLLSASVLR